jgi:hypothetical protein
LEWRFGPEASMAENDSKKEGDSKSLIQVVFP